MVQLGPAASVFLVAFYVVSSAVLIALIGAAAYLVLRLNRLLEQYQEKIDPLLVKADQALTIIADKADSIGGKAESLLTQSEEVAESVHEKVDRTAIAVQRTINAPIISANSLVAGFTRGFSTFAKLSRPEGQQAEDAEAVRAAIRAAREQEAVSESVEKEESLLIDSLVGRDTFAVAAARSEEPRKIGNVDAIVPSEKTEVRSDLQNNLQNREPVTIGLRKEE
jgi:hypothetical protein